MPSFVYLDASDLVKLAVHEAETPALERAVLNSDALFTSEAGAIELQRVLTRTGRPLTLRTLDAIDVATAVSLLLPGLDFITYDDRQAHAARAHGLRVLQRGKRE